MEGIVRVMQKPENRRKIWKSIFALPPRKQKSGFFLILLILALAIKLDSPGTVMFRQVRVTQYGREFRIFKFRTMVSNAQQLGTQVTVKGDARITRVGKLIRK